MKAKLPECREPSAARYAPLMMRMSSTMRKRCPSPPTARPLVYASATTPSKSPIELGFAAGPASPSDRGPGAKMWPVPGTGTGIVPSNAWPPPTIITTTSAEIATVLATRRKTVHGAHVVAHELPARRRRQELDQLRQLRAVARCVVGVREVGGPEELVLADVRDDARERALVRVARDPALALEVDARLLRESGVPSERRRVDRVHPLEPVADPARARLEDDHLQARELLEHAVLEHRRERVPHAVRRRDVDEERERRVRHPPEPARRGPERLEAGMDGDRQPELRREPEDAVVVGMAGCFPRHHERRDEDALHAVARRARELALGFVGETEGDVRDRHEPTAAARAELDDPAVVDARVRLRELDVLAFRLPEHAERRVEHRDVEILLVEAREPLARIPRAEAGVVEVAEAGRLAAGRRRDAADQVHRAEALRQVAAHHLRWPAGDLEVLETLRVAPDAERPVAEARLEHAVPEIGGLEHVTVRVDRAVERKPRQHAVSRRRRRRRCCRTGPPRTARRRTLLRRAGPRPRPRRDPARCARPVVGWRRRPAPVGPRTDRARTDHLRSRRWLLRTGVRARPPPRPAAQAPQRRLP